VPPFHSNALAVLTAVVLGLGMVGCQASVGAAVMAGASPTVTPTSPAASTVGPRDAPSDSPRSVTVWAQIPSQANDCACHTPPLANVYSALKDEHLDGGFKDEGLVESTQFFSVTFDPRTVSTERVVALITSNGGTIRPGPPPR
jgi:hypothetical protein